MAVEIDPTAGYTANREDMDRLQGLQRENAKRINQFVQQFQQTPNFTGLLMEEIINAIFVQGSQEHIDFMTTVELRIAVLLEDLIVEAQKTRLVIPGQGTIPGIG